MVPIGKHEYIEGGDVWIEGTTADPDERRARDGDENRMRVTIRLFARLRDLVGRASSSARSPQAPRFAMFGRA